MRPIPQPISSTRCVRRQPAQLDEMAQELAADRQEIAVADEILFLRRNRQEAIAPDRFQQTVKGGLVQISL